LTEIIAFEKNVRNDFIEHLGKYLSNKYKVKVERKGKKLIMRSEHNIRNKLIGGKLEIFFWSHRLDMLRYLFH